MVRTFFFLIFVTLNVFASADDNLSLSEARSRKFQVKNIDYDIFLELSKGTDSFKGKTKIRIELNHLKSDLIIDAQLKNFELIKINEKVAKNLKITQGKIEIPKALLGKLIEIEILYSSNASNESRGLRRIKDTRDNEEYLFTDFEPFYAHWMFPCIDQPDIKGKFKFTVNVPEEWKVINNELIETEKVESGRKTVVFQKTPILSTYLVFVGAGPYAEWKDEFGKIPLYIHARKSMSKFVDADKIFETFKKGLKFYTEYFDHPYPYSKYGQIFVPDLAMNAIENAGAVTFHEMFLFMGPVPSVRRENRENIMLHELAHMWFGDLVTMKWWSDLWLKEGFATYLAGLAQTREIKSEYGKLDMLYSKSWGYWQDLMVTTHPIESDIPDVRASRGIFDGITYAKGAAALKQLHFYVGEEGFQKGVRNYFKKFALKNADREDFLKSIADASGKDLNSWGKQWLQTSGANKIRFHYTCTKNQVTDAKLTQQPSSSGQLSPHRTILAFYKKGKANLELQKTVDVTIESSEKFIEELNGEPCPQFVLPNYQDEDYALYTLDETSLRTASLALTKLPDALSRTQVWIILMQMVKDQELSPKVFMEMVKEGMKFEKDDNILGFLFSKNLVARDFRQIYSYFLTVSERTSYSRDLEKIIWQRIELAEPGSSLQSIFFDVYTGLAQSKEAQERILLISMGKNVPKGIDIDPERRWRLYRMLSSNGHPESLKLIEAEKKFDSSMLAEIMSVGATASFPDMKIKKETFEHLFNPEGWTYNQMIQAAGGLNSADYPEFMKKLADDYFSRISNLDWEKNDDYVMPYFLAFPGLLCSKEIESQSEKAFKNAKHLTNISRKAWMEAQDNLSRCVKVRAKKW